MVSIYAIVFRRSLINKYNIKANKINRYEDACFIGQYAYCVGFDKEYKDSTFPIYCYRHNKNSLTNATQISNEEVLKADIQSCWLI